MSLRVKAVCFDLDDTLWPVQPVLQRAERLMHEFLEREHPRLAACFGSQELWEERMSLAREHPQFAHHMTWLRTEALRRLAVRHAHDPAVGEAAFSVFKAARNEVDVYADVTPSLQRLAQRFRLATFSNGNADVDAMSIGNHFEVTLNAESVGYAKPHVEAFLAISRALGLPPREILYVGDSPQADVQGALGAGCRAVWVNRQGSEWPAQLEARADLEVASLTELVDHLHG
ncbi:MAG: HAD-IA family hydrolase [Sinobacteraceae bacterium]|nr:HAD-IA family hydrolase [Nevskiaceae bacterium]